MQFEKHTLMIDRPNHQHAIHHLKMHDAHFSKMFDSYHELETEVHNIKTINSPVKDQDIESLKRKVHLRNELFDIIQKTERALLSKSFLRAIRSLHVCEI